MKRGFGNLYRMLKRGAKHPRVLSHVVDVGPSVCDGYTFAQAYTECMLPAGTSPAPVNPLWEYFQNHEKGHGLWKWEHYFDIYHRHFARFVSQKVNVLEVGIYSGGSLEMWRSYFGEDCHIYGVDIEEACKAYENDHISVFIGDQADRTFWRNLKDNVKDIDIVIDDGGHTPEQQQITLEELLPNLRPGGVYLCEDVHGSFNRFSAFASALVHELNSFQSISGSILQSSASSFQSAIHSIHFYPYVVVIEKHRAAPTTLSSPKRGTEWQPFPCD
jgi:SAM-dependent methyltransferase